MANDLVLLGKDLNTGQFITGNRLGRGRPLGSKPKLSEKFISELAKHFSKHGAKAIERVYNDDPATYLKLVAHLVPRETLAKLEVTGEIELKAEVQAFVTSYEQCQRMIGADVEDAEIIPEIVP